MGLKIERWIAISFMIILYTDICIGQTTLLPEMVPFENEAWKLICKANTFTSTVSIGGPSGSTIGFCIPGAASCSANSGYALAINVTETTVTMTRTLTNNDNGTWTCSHTGGSANYVLQSPLLSRNFPQSKTNYFDYAMTASPGIEIDTTDPDYTFTFHYGCISTNLKFKWTTVPGVPWDDTLNTASTDLTCNTNQAFKSTQLTSVILPKVTQDGSKLKVSVYVDGYDNVQAVEEYTFNVTFSASRHHTTTVEISTIITDEQTIFSTKSSMSTQDFHTTETTDNTASYTSLYELSEVSSTLSIRSVNRDAHLYLILTIVICSVCAVMFIMVLLIILFYLCGRPSCSYKSKTNNKSVKSADQSDNTNHREKGVRSIRIDNLNVKTANVGGKKKKNDKNKKNDGKRLNDQHRQSTTENDFQFYHGRPSQSNYAFKLNEPVETRQNQMTYVTERSEFDQIQTFPYNIEMKVNNNHGQTRYSGRKILAFPQYYYNFSRTLRNQPDRFNFGGHHFNDRGKYSNYPYVQQRSNVVNANYRYDRRLSRTSHSGYLYDKNWLDIMDTKDNQPSFREGQR